MSAPNRLNLLPNIAHGLVSYDALGRGAVPMLGNLSSVLFGRPMTKAPVWVTWALTERCSMKCGHCSFGPKTPELDHVQRTAVARRLGRSGVWGVSLIGGEPTLVEQLADYAAILKEEGRYVTVGTSGFRLARHLDGLIACGVDSIVISVDHMRAAEHDAFRGRAGLFDEASAAVARIRGTDGQRPRAQVRCTIHRGNFREIPEIVEHWRTRADHVVLQVVQNNGIHQVRDPGVLFQPEDRPDFEAMLARLLLANPALRSRYFDHMADYLFDGEALRKRLDYRCLVVPGASTTLMPDGELRLCYGHEESRIGNMLDADLEQVWASAATRGIRGHMQSRELACMCWEQVNSTNLDILPLAHGVEKLTGLGGGQG